MEQSIESEQGFILVCRRCGHDRVRFPHTPSEVFPYAPDQTCEECRREDGPCLAASQLRRRLVSDLPSDLEEVGCSFGKMLQEPGGCFFVPLYVVLFFASGHYSWKVVDRLLGDTWGKSVTAGLLYFVAWGVLFSLFYLGACWPLRRIQNRFFGSHG